MPSRVVVDDDEQIIADLLKRVRRLETRQTTTRPYGTHDEFTVAATPETEYQLTYIPVSGTCAMYVNGLEQEEDTDYTVDYDEASATVGLVTFDTALTTGQRINFRYLITDWLVARSLPEDNGLMGPWIVLQPQWDVSGATPFVSATTSGYALIVQESEHADLTVDLTVTTTGGSSGAGIGFRATDNANFWFFVLAGSSSFLYKVVAGTYTQVGTWAGAAAGDVLTVVTSGSGITVKRNGSTVGTATDSFNATATQHGIYSESTAARFTDFSMSL